MPINYIRNAFWDRLYYILVQMDDCPLSELGGHLGIDAVTKRNNHIDIVKRHIVGFAIGGSSLLSKMFLMCSLAVDFDT